MKTETNINIELVIFWDSFNIDECTNTIWLNPTETWNKWDKNTKTNAPNRYETHWSYSIWVFKTPFFDDITSVFINKFDNKLDIINKFVEDNNLSVKIISVIKIENGITPWLFINKDFISFLYKLWAELDIDEYIYS